MKIGILWDLDGTLLDTIKDLQVSVNYALDQFSYPQRTLEEVLSFVGHGARHLITEAAPKGTDVDAVLATFQGYYKTHSQVYTKPYDGVMEALEELSETFPMAIVSNKPDPAVKLLCAEYFPKLYARGESSDCPRKPAPDMVHRAMAEIGADACIYVGDSEVDIETARNAGAMCLSVLWGFRDEKTLRQAGGTHFCADTSHLAEKIRQMAALF